jgi:hypothetical protein
MLLLTISFVYPENKNAKLVKKHPIRAVRAIVNAENIALFVFAGFLAGVSNKGGEFRELAFQDLGIAVASFGLILSASSLLGAVFGWYVHILDKLRPLSFYLLDLVIMSVTLCAMGISDNPIIAVAFFILFAGYTRVRMIIFQAKLLHEIQHSYKATLISALNLFTLVGDISAITLLTKFVGSNGYGMGYVLFGASVLGIGTTLWLIMVLESYHRRQGVIRP